MRERCDGAGRGGGSAAPNSTPPQPPSARGGTGAALRVGIVGWASRSGDGHAGRVLGPRSDVCVRAQDPTDLFDLIEVVGTGTYGEVYKVRDAGRGGGGAGDVG